MGREPARRENGGVPAPLLRIVVLALIALAALAPMAGAAPRPGTYGTRLGSHTMVYLDTPPAQQRAMFQATAEAGVRFLRMDFAIGLVFQRDRIDFSAVDRVNALAAVYGVQ